MQEILEGLCESSTRRFPESQQIQGCKPTAIVPIGAWFGAIPRDRAGPRGMARKSGEDVRFTEY